MPRVTLQCNESFVSHVSEIFLFYKSKILSILQTFDNSIAQRKVKFWKEKISLCAAMKLKRSEIVVLPPLYRPSNFQNERVKCCDEMGILLK